MKENGFYSFPGTTSIEVDNCKATTRGKKMMGNDKTSKEKKRNEKMRDIYSFIAVCISRMYTSFDTTQMKWICHSFMQESRKREREITKQHTREQQRQVYVTTKCNKIYNKQDMK